MTSSTARFRRFLPGEPAPWFVQRCTSNERYHFDTVAGRYILLAFFSSALSVEAQAALAFIQARRSLFDDDHLSFFGVSRDAEDEQQRRLSESMPGIRYIWDFDGAVSRLYGALPVDSESPPQSQSLWVLLDPALKLLAVVPFRGDGSDLPQMAALLGGLPPVAASAGIELHAPVIILPRVFEPALCDRLITAYDLAGGEPSGFMREKEGRTVGVMDNRHKSRRDYLIEDQALQQKIRQQIERKVRPVVRQVHHFDATRMERYIVGCYSAEESGHFRPHRDNSTKGTAHRRFAVSLNLNADFEGGALYFPEFGSRRYTPPPGGAVIFSGSLLHGVTPVSSGRRYAFLPFLYDDAAAAVREANLKFLDVG